MTVAALCRELGITPSAYYWRIRRGWTPEEMRQPRYQHRPRPDARSRPDLSAVLRAWKR